MSKADTKEKILETASELFATSGYHGASIRDIAKKAEVNLAAVNYHFNGKINHRFSERDRIYASVYGGSDSYEQINRFQSGENSHA